MRILCHMNNSPTENQNGKSQKGNNKACVSFLAMVMLSLLISGSPTVAGNCNGRFLNPITGICWRCIFPLTLAGVTIFKGDVNDPKPNRRFDCWCKHPQLLTKVPGIPISYFEPVRLVDVTRTPYCLVNLGGLEIMNSGVVDRGDTEETDPGKSHSFYQVHWYIYPVLYILEVLMDFVCLGDETSFDVAYLTELDPFWNDDQKNSIINPEAILFGNPLAQAACIADCLSSSAGYPLDQMFWCNGCQGSLYPFSGNIEDHEGGVQASLLATGRFMAKMHRQFLLKGYMGEEGWCGKYSMPIIRKSQYRTQMTYPLPQTDRCQVFGSTEVTWQPGKEYPYKGEDFGYLIWRKRDCCMTLIPSLGSS